MVKFISSALFFVLSCSASAASSTEAECPTRDHSAKLGEVRNQGQIGWCYANAAADLLTFRYHKELNGQKVSQAHVALSYNEFSLQDSNAEGGFGFAAVKSYLRGRNGLCPQKIEDQVLAQGEQLPLRERLKKLITLKQKYDLQVEDSTRWNDYFQYLQELKREKSVLGKIDNMLLHRVLHESTEKNFSLNLANALCAKDLIPIQKKPEIDADITALRLWNNDYLIETIQEQLGRGNILALAYHASIFKGDDITNDSRHMSVIVGQRWNKEDKTCEYKIRNSWGKSCSAQSYPNPIFQKKGACEEGNVWIPEALLKETMYGISYFRD